MFYFIIVMDEETKSNNSDIINLESDSELESNSESQESPKSSNSQESQELMKIDYSYPDPADPELQLKLYKKREFYYHATKQRPDINDYNDIKEYRDNICDRHFGLHEHQAMLGNFINPNTPYIHINITQAISQKAIREFVTIFMLLMR